jgi:hypothetical protein
MVRTAESPVIQHFIYSTDKNKSKCKYCPKDYEGKVITNLRRHLESFHTDIYKSVTEEEEAREKRKLGECRYTFKTLTIFYSTVSRFYTRVRILIPWFDKIRLPFDNYRIFFHNYQHLIKSNKNRRNHENNR